MERAERRHPARLRALPSWLINQAAITANRLTTQELAGAGMRRYQFALLTALAEAGPASQAELSRGTSIDRSDMVATINDLAERGLVERMPDPADRRRNVVTITPAGRRELQALDRGVKQAQDALLAPLSAEDRAQLVELLTRVVEHHATIKD